MTVPERYQDLLGDHARPKELDRLNALAEELDPATARRVAKVNPQPTWHCLEIGAGTGTIAAWLARRCPHGHVTATDVDLRFLDDRGLPNLEVLRHDVTADELPPASFDLIHARYVFAHLREREPRRTRPTETSRWPPWTPSRRAWGPTPIGPGRSRRR